MPPKNRKNSQNAREATGNNGAEQAAGPSSSSSATSTDQTLAGPATGDASSSHNNVIDQVSASDRVVMGSPSSSTNAPLSKNATNLPGAAVDAAATNQPEVTDYLLKRGYNRTEEIFRKENMNLGPDGRPQHKSTEEMGFKKYGKAFRLLKKFIDGNLDYYKFELKKFLWPIFIHCYLELVEGGWPNEAKSFLNEFKDAFGTAHGDDLKLLSTITLPAHVKENEMTKMYKSEKYHIPVTRQVNDLVLGYMTKEFDNGGHTIIALLAQYCHVKFVDRGLANPHSFLAIFYNQPNARLEEADVTEGIQGVFTGVRANAAPDVALKLGPLPMEPELLEDVRSELEEEDRMNPPIDGRSTLLDEFDNKIKREESADGPARADLPLPPARARDVLSEVEKIKQYRDRFRIEGRTGGVGAAVSICMYTFHNTLGSYTTMEFSKDHKLVAAGTMDSYIRVWSMDGKPLKSALDGNQSVTNNRMLIGHSAPIFGLSFSDAVSWPNSDGTSNPQAPQLLLSSSGDGQIRLWSLDTWSCLCVYKSHDGPVWKVQWGPHGHYFASAGWDKTARIWSQDHASPLRICVGHDTSISALAWHPNGTYIFTASDETDKSIRMWSVITGDCVRVMTGHHHFINTIECAPNGKIIASADVDGNIFWWDLEKGACIKKSKGHGKGGITSLSFSVESTVLVKPVGGSSGQAVQAENVHVNIGDSIGPADRTITVGGQPQAPPASAAASSSAAGANASGTSGASGSKKKGKEVHITPDQISAFPTKKTPVKKVQFTRMNLVIAAGVYEPER
ncbi:Transcription initiation factor TFIID subunit 5 [Cytospora mali]|uniref:Transcription initiation factor TFIID subunit 5 n=1 Tax=Cytospora mali TaxID=578113 RepID=A0A194V243_CYTMA|nr:Transcription initiation factor TFIID subunit 5 [Valsa mali var. pyri (nom. inval.)]